MIMQVTIESQEGLTFALKGRVDPETFKNKRLDYAKSIQRDFEFKGFRRGKVPLSIVVSQIDEKTVEDLKGRLAINAIMDFFGERSLELYRLNDFKIGDLLLDGSFEFTASVAAIPVLKDIHDYLGVEIDEPTMPPVDDKAVEEEIKRFIEDHPDFEKADPSFPAHEGDKAVCSVVIRAKGDGKVLLDSEPMTYSVGLSSSPFEDFGRHLIGLKAGETKEVDCQYPDIESGESLQDVQASATITMVEVLRQVAPVLSDEYVRRMTQFSSVEEFRQHVRRSLEAERETKIREQVEQAVIEAIYKKNYFDLPPKTVEMFAREQAEEMSSHVVLTDQYEKPVDFVDLIMKSDRFVAKARDELIRRIILSAVVDKEKIEPSGEEIREYLQSIANEKGIEFAKISAAFAVDREFNYTVVEKIKMDKAMDLLRRYAVAKPKVNEEAEAKAHVESDLKVSEELGK
jgi:trigger factor